MLESFTNKQKLLFLFTYIIILNVGINTLLPYPEQEEGSFSGYGIFLEQASVRSSHSPIFNQVRIFYDAIPDDAHRARISPVSKICLIIRNS